MNITGIISPRPISSSPVASAPDAQPVTMTAFEQVIVGGDLSTLSPAERVSYYAKTCESLGLNPLTRPFEYVRLNGKLTLYARKDATDQVRSLRKVSLSITSRERLDGDLYVVTARASLPSGRHDESTGAVCLAGLRGEALANALMKAETKAKRRATLSLCGLGWLDETEVDSIADARRVRVNDDGELVSSSRQLEAPAADVDAMRAELLELILKLKEPEKAEKAMREWAGDNPARLAQLLDKVRSRVAIEGHGQDADQSDEEVPS